MIDLHIHTNNSDGSDTVEEILKKIGPNDIISITDHCTVDAYPINDSRVIPGIELTAALMGKMVHILGYNFELDKMKTFLKSTYNIETRKTYPSAEEAINGIHDCGGEAYFAHPFNYHLRYGFVPYGFAKDATELLILKGIDGIEVFHPSANEEDVKLLKELKTKYKLKASGGSDYHGEYRFNELFTGINNNLKIKPKDIDVKGVRFER